MENEFKGQKSLQGEEKEPKIIKKIEVLRAEDFYNPYEDEFDEEYYREQMEDYYKDAEAKEEPKEEPLGYEPFDPIEELKNIRNLSPIEQSLPSKEKRKIRAERLAKYKENLMRQKQGIAQAIADLFNAVESAPDMTKEELLLKVKTLAPEYKFTKKQLAYFKYAIEEYLSKHLAVEKYRAMYLKDDDLFEACFGKKPEGKIEVVKGPMTLYFRCYDRDDFAFIDNFSKHGGDEKLFKKMDFSVSRNISGVALRSVKIEELAGTVTAENVGINARYELIRGMEQTREIHGSEFELFIPMERGDIDIEVRGVGKWKVKIAEFDESGEPLRLQFFNLNEDLSKPIFDFLCVKPTEEMKKNGNFLGVLKRVGDEKLFYNVREYLYSGGGKRQGQIEMDRSFLKIIDESLNGTVVTFREDHFAMIPEKEISEKTRIHEDQHEFNKLCRPLEIREDYMTMMSRAVFGAKTPEEAKQNLISGFVRKQRKWIGIDTSARDEILAHYKEGIGTKQILKNLTESKFYDYAKQEEKRLANTPFYITEEIKREISEVFYEEIEGVLNFVGLEALVIDEADVLPHIEAVFKDEYKADLKKWIDSISLLEQKGYAREEIISILYQEPVNSWPILARRIQTKISNPKTQIPMKSQNIV